MNIYKNCIQLYLMGAYWRKFRSSCPPGGNASYATDIETMQHGIDSLYSVVSLTRNQWKLDLWMWFLRIFPDFLIFFFFYKFPFASKLSWKKRSSLQGKKEVACIVSKPLVSCLCGCGESVNPLKLNIYEVQGLCPLQAHYPRFRIVYKCHITLREYAMRYACVRSNVKMDLPPWSIQICNSFHVFSKITASHVRRNNLSGCLIP